MASLSWAMDAENGAKKPLGKEELDMGVADTGTGCVAPTTSTPPSETATQFESSRAKFCTLKRQEALLVWMRDSELMCPGQSRRGRSAEGRCRAFLSRSPRQIVSGTNEDTALEKSGS